VLAIAMVFLPAAGGLPKGFPADVLGEFRLASLSVQALLWASLGLILRFLAERALEPKAAPADEAGARTYGHRSTDGVHTREDRRGRARAGLKGAD
jgi:hypothetical protein